jgi:hypothetical protein
MNLNPNDPVHLALIQLAFAAAQLVEDLHDYQHYLGGREDWPFDLSVIEKHYDQITIAWEQFQASMRMTEAEKLPPAPESLETEPDL